MIELKIDDKWKWAAMDDDGNWYAYLEMPTVSQNYWKTPPETQDCGLSVFNLPQHDGSFKDSLHEIKDGKLVKYVDIPADGERVIVREGGMDFRRYSSGQISPTGSLAVYCDGADRWTSKGEISFWKNWRRPTSEELEE